MALNSKSQNMFVCAVLLSKGNFPMIFYVQRFVVDIMQNCTWLTVTVMFSQLTAIVALTI